MILPPLFRFFRGKIDDCEIKLSEDGGTATIVLTCESVSRDLTVQRTDTRSDASCKVRFPADDFYQYTGVQRDKPLPFGRPG